MCEPHTDQFIKVFLGKILRQFTTVSGRIKNKPSTNINSFVHLERRLCSTRAAGRVQHGSKIQKRDKKDSCKIEIFHFHFHFIQYQDIVLTP